HHEGRIECRGGVISEDSVEVGVLSVVRIVPFVSQVEEEDVPLGSNAVVIIFGRAMDAHVDDDGVIDGEAMIIVTLLAKTIAEKLSNPRPFRSSWYLP